MDNTNNNPTQNNNNNQNINNNNNTHISTTSLLRFLPSLLQLVDPNIQMLTTNNISSHDYETERLLRETLNTPSTYKYVLDPSVYKTDIIKQLTYSTSNENQSQFQSQSQSQTNRCPISLEEFEEGELISQLPCNHVFKQDAIQNWLETQKAECPVCRFKLPCIEVRNEDEQTYTNSISNAQSQSQSQQSETEHHRPSRELTYAQFMQQLNETIINNHEDEDEDENPPEDNQTELNMSIIQLINSLQNLAEYQNNIQNNNQNQN